VGASGFSYEEAAAICESAVGTMKSRVNRARTRLSKLLSIDSRRQARPGLHNACRSDRGRTRLIGSSTRCQLLLVPTVCWTLPAWGMGDPPERPIFRVPLTNGSTRRLFIWELELLIIACVRTA